MSEVRTIYPLEIRGSGCDDCSQRAAWIITTMDEKDHYACDEHAYRWRAMNAQALINRMCAAPLVIQYEDEELHTDDRPFCADMRCECHNDSELWQAYIYQPWLDGILTIEAGAALFSGR